MFERVQVSNICKILYNQATSDAMPISSNIIKISKRNSTQEKKIVKVNEKVIGY